MVIAQLLAALICLACALRARRSNDQRLVVDNCAIDQPRAREPRPLIGSLIPLIVSPSCCFMSVAAWDAVSSGRTTVGFGVIRSLTFIGRAPPTTRPAAGTRPRRS